MYWSPVDPYNQISGAILKRMLLDQYYRFRCSSLSNELPHGISRREEVALTNALKEEKEK